MNGQPPGSSRSRPDPPPGVTHASRRPPTGRPRDHERRTRKPMAWWDRVKVLVVLLSIWLLLVWGTASTSPGLPIAGAFVVTAISAGWLLVLAAVEIVRQVHFAVSERSEAYHLFWMRRFAIMGARTSRIDPWTAYRLARVVRWVFWLAVIDLLLARLLHVSVAVALLEAPALLFQALPFILQVAVIGLITVGQFALLFWFLARGGYEVYYPDDVTTRFSDVWGQDHVLARIRENTLFLEQPEAIEDVGGYVPGGILLWGPPGTGKTLMAEAVAGETGKPFVFVDPGAFMNMFFGVGVLKVRGLFRRLRKLSLRYGGVIVFFDEADSLGNRGSLAAPGAWGRMQATTPSGGTTVCNGNGHLSPAAVSALYSQGQATHAAQPTGAHRDRQAVPMMGGSGGMGTLEALLSELSGLKKPRGFFNRRVRRLLGMRPKPPPKYRILIMMATNMPQSLDEALLRPGRIDRIYRVGYPSKAGRIRTFEGYLAKVPHLLTQEHVDRLATMTPYATGATIKDMVNEALITAIRDGRRSIQWRDMIKAKQVKELGPSEDVEYIERERHAVAVHEACHAVVAYRMRQHLTIDLATIDKGSSYLGMVASIPPEDQFTHWRSEHEADIMVALASLAGERLFFESDSSSGVSGDLEAATQLAMLMEAYWGMGSSLASHAVTHQAGIGPGGRHPRGDENNLLRHDLGDRIEQRLGQLLERTHDLLAKERSVVLSVAHALEQYKTITGEDVQAVILGTEGPLVDGRLYATPSARESLEHYHRDAVRAHRAHGPVEVALPLLTPAAAIFPDDHAEPVAPS